MIAMTQGGGKRGKTGVKEEVRTDKPAVDEGRSGMWCSARWSPGRRKLKKLLLVLCLAAGLWAGLFAAVVLADTPTPDVNNGTLSGLPSADVNQIGLDVRRVFNIFFSVLGFVAAGFIAWNAVNLGRKDPRARQEAMAGLGYSIVGAVLLFGTWFIISLASGFLNSGG